MPRTRSSSSTRARTSSSTSSRTGSSSGSTSSRASRCSSSCSRLSDTDRAASAATRCAGSSASLFLVWAVWLVVEVPRLDPHALRADRPPRDLPLRHRLQARRGDPARAHQQHRLPPAHLRADDRRRRPRHRVGGRAGQSSFDNVRHPDMVQQEIYRQMEANARERPATAPTRSPRPSATRWGRPVREAARRRRASPSRSRSSRSCATRATSRPRSTRRRRPSCSSACDGGGHGARVVSLVPSATETLLALGVVPVACTRFCEQPGIPTVGGTKNPDVAAIVALAPDLVVVNDEENRVEDFDALRRRGAERPLDVAPRVDDVGAAVARARRCGRRHRPRSARLETWNARLAELRAGGFSRVRAVTFVWRRPWMTLSETTYGSSVLDLIGFDNVFAGATRPVRRGDPRGGRRAGTAGGPPAERALRVRAAPPRRGRARAPRLRRAKRLRPRPLLVGHAHPGCRRPAGPDAALTRQAGRPGSNGPAAPTARAMNATGSSPDTCGTGDGLGDEVVRVVALDERDDAPAEPGAREPRAERARLDERLDEEVELGRRHLEVVAQAAVAREQQRAERVRRRRPGARRRTRARARSR